MGCCDCKLQNECFDLDLGVEDSLMYKVESAHPFSKIPVKLLTREFLVNSRENLIPRRNFIRACENLTINLDESSDFLAALRESPEDYQTEKVILVSILLSSGRLPIKLECLFEYCDHYAMGVVDKSALAHLIDQLLDIACNVIPLLSVHQIEYSQYVEYIAYLNNNRNGLLYRIVNQLPKSVSTDKLIHQFHELGVMKGLTPRTLRKMLFDESNNPYSKREEWSFNASTATKLPNFFPQPQESDVSEASSEPILIQVQIGQRTENFVFYLDEDPLTLAEEFSLKNSLTPEERHRFFSSVSEIKNSLISE